MESRFHVLAYCVIYTTLEDWFLSLKDDLFLISTFHKLTTTCARTTDLITRVKNTHVTEFILLSDGVTLVTNDSFIALQNISG